MQKLHDAFEVQLSTWDRQYRKATGYFRGSLTGLGVGESESYSTSFRFLIKTPNKDATLSSELAPKIVYSWTEIGLWTQFRQGHSSVMICCISESFGNCLAEDVRRSLFSDRVSVSLSHPFAWHAFALAHISHAFHAAVWKCRDLVRAVETTRPNVRKQQTDYAALHEISRHVFHSTETLAMSVDVVDNILCDLEIVCSDRTASAQCREALRTIKCQKTLLKCELGRSQALESRLRNEIDLVILAINPPCRMALTSGRLSILVHNTTV